MADYVKFNRSKTTAQAQAGDADVNAIHFTTDDGTVSFLPLDESKPATQLYGFPFELIPTDYETSIAAPLSPQSSTEAYYTLGGTRIASPKRGITIVRTSDGKAKKIFTR